MTRVLAARADIADVVQRLRAHSLLPYLGPGMATLTGFDGPASYADIAAFLGARVALPKRARGNAFAAAQYIEGNKHRTTLDKLLNQAFAAAATPTPLHRFLADLRPPLIIDTWYDDAMRLALAPCGDWGEIQGISRGQPGEARWWRAYDSAGEDTDAATAGAWQTLLYKPHGGVRPRGNFLLTDADYVEVLTELDIQTPIPDTVQQRRAGRGFLFLGCRMDDQMLRAYARQVLKRSGGGHVAVLQTAELTRNERRVLDELDIAVLDMALADAALLLLDGLAGAPAARQLQS